LSHKVLVSELKTWYHYSKSVWRVQGIKASMPNRYEREIEEILRNLESTEPKQSIGQKFGERLRRKPNYRVKPPRRTAPSLKFGVAEWLIVTAVIAALIAGGYAYAHDGQATLVTGILAIIGAICLLLLALSQFIFRSPRSSQASRYSNVRPLRRNPLNSLKTRWHLFLLKLRYRRQNRR